MPIPIHIPLLPLSLDLLPGLLLLLMPFVSFVLALALGKKRSLLAGRTSLALMLAAFGLGIWLAFHAWESPLHWRFEWIRLGSEELRLLLTGGIFVDRLSLLMVLLVCGISSLVFLFSQAYMHGDKHIDRYWAYLSFFVFAMLGILLSDNLLFIFIFWELVGLSSYLLIGFWFEKEAAAKASQKAFLLNRIGDVLFFAGLLLIYSQCKSLDIEILKEMLLENEGITAANYTWLRMGGLLLLGGAIGKSAQFPLQVWLPDAMEGPTPVSSLIHAATMVAAGIYLLARFYFLLDVPVLHLVAGIGGLTSLMAAVAALSQWDIKKVLAYSTLSQLGYMMIGLGVQAWDMAIFHLFTHAFFKCALFLIAGAIIHQLHGLHLKSKDGIPPENDMRNMGGLKGPLRYLYLPPMLALAGLPLFSGFLSKDGIILASFSWANHHGGWTWIIPAFALLTAFLTAFYIGRQGMLIFGGKARTEFSGPAVSWKMILPIAVLSLLSCWIFFSINPLEGSHGWLVESLEQPQSLFNLPILEEFFPHTLVLLLSVTLGMGGLALAYFRYRKGIPEGEKKGSWGISYWHFYQDWFYENVIAAFVIKLSQALAWIDHQLVDGLVALFARLTVNSTKEIDSVGEASVEADKTLDKGLDQMGHLLTPSLSKMSSDVDHRLIDGLVNGLVKGLLRIGRRTGQTQKSSVQGYFVGIFLGLLLASLIIIWIIR